MIALYPPLPPALTPLPIAVLLSGTGRTLANLLDRIAHGTLPAVVRVVVGTKAGLGGQTVAENAGVPYQVIARRQYHDGDAFSAAIWDTLAPYGVRLVVLAGFLQRLRIPPAWQGRVINIHPALLPSFGGAGMYGHHVHAAVLAHGCKVSGCTVHLCDDTYDTGPIIAQQCVPVARRRYTGHARRARLCRRVRAVSTGDCGICGGAYPSARAACYHDRGDTAVSYHERLTVMSRAAYATRSEYMRLIWINTLLCIVAIVLVSASLEHVSDTIRLLLTLVIVFLGVYRLSDIVRQED